MRYNHGKAERLFKERWTEEEHYFKSAGMTDEQIKTIWEFEREIFNSDRRYYENTVTVDNEDVLERLRNVEIPKAMGRYFWLEEANAAAYQQIKQLPAEWIEAFTMYIYDGYNQEQISSILPKSQSSISRWIDKIAEILKNENFGA